MQKLTYRIFLLLLPILTLAGCNDDDFPGGTLSLDGDLPVVFDFAGPDDAIETRGTDDYKKLFEDGDLIHIEATFTDENGATATTYAAMRLNGRKWELVDGSTLYWPYDAKRGTFKAYYVYNSNGLLVRGSSTRVVNLSDVKDDQDPLEATTENVKYGNAVNMKFYHACTYLTLEEMEANVTDYYWMVFPDQNNPIKNAYQLTLDNSGHLTLDFISVPDPDYGNLVYISRRSENVIGEEGKVTSKASFYLAPGVYNNFDLRTNNNLPFMSFVNSLTFPLEANHPYTLNVVNSKGASFSTTTEVDWDEKDDAWKVNVPEFLRAASEGKDYTEKDAAGEDVPILKNVNGSLVLMRNLDFDKFTDYDKLGFFPDISSATIFEGNLHYIENLGYPLFRFNYGTIQNLGLKNLDATIIANEGTFDDNYANDLSRIGGLCMWNRTDSNIKNVRMENFNMTVKVHAEDPRINNYNENYSIGGLCGDNWGTISDIAVKGAINITVGPENASGDYSVVDANINIGGIIGNHTYILTNVGPQAGGTFSVILTNNCKGRDEWGSGVFCMGGAVGQSTGSQIAQIVISNLKINAENSDGYQQYIGGLTGRLRGNDGYSVSDCTVQGTLSCGTVSKFGEAAINPFSYMGGISGDVRGYRVTSCRAACEIKSSLKANEGSTYATGGAFGRIEQGSELQNNSAYGTSLSGPVSNGSSNFNDFVGTFAGISQIDITWDVLQRAGNTALNIGTYPEIGSNLNDTD